MSPFIPVGKIPEKANFKEERFISSCFEDVSPWLAGFVVFDKEEITIPYNMAKEHHSFYNSQEREKKIQARGQTKQ